MVRRTAKSRLRNIHDLVPEDDLAQEMALARLAAEAKGEDPARAARAAREAFCRACRAEASLAATGSSLSDARVDLDWLPEAASVARLPAESPTERQLRAGISPDRPFSDLAMFVCYVAGMRQREIGRAFGVQPARVGEAVKRMRARTGITRARDQAIRTASSKSPKGRMVRVDGKQVWINRYRPGDVPAASASCWRTPR